MNMRLLAACQDFCRSGEVRTPGQMKTLKLLKVTAMLLTEFQEVCFVAAMLLTEFQEV